MNGSTVLDRPAVAVRQATRCASCGGELIVVDINASGESVRFSSCTRCETRRWSRNDQTLDVAEFLAEVAHADTRYQRS